MFFLSITKYRILNNKKTTEYRDDSIWLPDKKDKKEKKKEIKFKIHTSK